MSEETQKLQKHFSEDVIEFIVKKPFDNQDLPILLNILNWKKIDSIIESEKNF